MAYRLDPLRPVAEEAVRVIRERVRKAVASAGTSQIAARDRIHAARTNTKKLRALLALAVPPGGKRRRKLDRQIARPARRLGSWRDADAMPATIDKLACIQPSDVPPRAWGAIRETLAASGGRPTEQARKIEAELRRFARDLERIGRRLGAATFSDDFKPLAKNFSKAYREARRAFRLARASPCAKSFHEWRKATKTVAYECRLLREAWPGVMKSIRHEFEDVSALLGAEHDLTVLRAQTRRCWAEKKLPLAKAEATSALEFMTRRRQQLRAELLPRGERLFADRPAALRHRIAAWWRVAAASPLGAAA